MMLVKRIIGGVIVLTSLIGLAVAIIGAIQLQGTAGHLEREVVSGMDFGIETLEVVSQTLGVMTQTLNDASVVIDSAAVSSQETADTLASIRPSIQQLSDLVAFDIPNNIKAIQDTMPALEQASAAIDTTLRTLAAFQWSTTIPLVDYELGFGLGIEYEPEVPLDQSVAQVSTALDGLPNHLTGIQSDLLKTHRSMGQAVTSINQVGDDLATVSADLHTAVSVLAEYDDLVNRASERVRVIRRDIRHQVQIARLALTALLVWLALSQLAPLYLGCTLLFPKRSHRTQDDAVTPMNGTPSLSG